MAHKNSFVESWDSSYLDNLKDGFNYAAGDYESLKQAIWKYIAIQSQEDFNDWSDSGEVGMFVNGLSYLGENINYRIDLNANDNFITTATRTSSVLNFAKLLTYTPKRNVCANGLAKIISISTTEPVQDYNGRSLANTTIRWNDSSNNDWQNQFLTILNSAFVYTNPFGKPCKSESIDDVSTQIYKINSEKNNNGGVYSFSMNINNETITAEVVNSTIDDNKITEHTPDIYDTFGLIYRNSGAGNASADTGFFVYWKQGTLQSETYNFDTYIRYQKIQLEKTNINDTDVWVQEIDPTTEIIKTNWRGLSSDEYIAYSTRKQTDANIYKVETTTDDGVLLTFPDGNFGNVPMGYYRIYYRTSYPTQMFIGVKDIQNITVTIPYKSSSNTSDDTVYYLKLTFSAQDESQISQNIEKEDLDSIKERAPEVASCQNRMISNSDYNYYPLTLGNRIKKIMTVNRFSSGNSRFVDLNDASGLYKSANIEGEDGYIYETEVAYLETNISVVTPSEFVTKKIAPLFNSTKLRNYYYSNYEPQTWGITDDVAHILWKEKSAISSTDSAGYFSLELVDAPLSLPDNMMNGSLVKLGDKPFESFAKHVYWVRIDNATDKNAIRINQSLGTTSKWYVYKYYPTFRTEFTNDEVSSISDEIRNGNNFYLVYNYNLCIWEIKIVAEGAIPEKWSAYVYISTETDENGNPIWNITMNYLEYIFGSENSTVFFVGDSNDTIKIFQYNYKSGDANESLDKDYYWAIYENVYLSNGLTDNNKVEVTFNSSDDDGTPDNPAEFSELILPTKWPTVDDNRYILFRRDIDTDELQVDKTILIFNTPGQMVDKVQNTGVCFTIYGDTVYEEGKVVDRTKINSAYNKEPYVKNSDNTATITIGQDFTEGQDPQSEYNNLGEPNPMFWMVTKENGKTKYIPIEDDSYIYKIGKSNIIFLWKHTPTKNLIMDPAASNLLDMYILTTEYYNIVQNWLSSKVRGPFPVYPTCEELRQQFKSLENNKATSDSLIYHPIKYKLLFGAEANEEMRCSFKVIKGNTTISDNEIKQQIITLIDKYFESMEIGQSFYFTNLSAYIKYEMNGLLNSFVPVPSASGKVFGDLFEIQCDKDEILLSCATVNDIQLISSISKYKIKMGS